MFSTKIKIRFNHVDPAGIVFYPRYYEMINQVVEEWFEGALDSDFRELRDDYKAGIPAISINAEFFNPSRLGDIVEFTLSLDGLGNSSINFTIEGKVGAEPRLKAVMTLVFIHNDNGVSNGPQRVPEPLRSAMLAT